jgi:hypothetical protein
MAWAARLARNEFSRVPPWLDLCGRRWSPCGLRFRHLEIYSAGKPMKNLYRTSVDRFVGGVVAFYLLLVAFPFGPQAIAGSAASQSPQGAIDTTLVDFYRWYVGEIAKEKDPQSDDRAKFAGYVAKPLAREINKEAHNADIEVDYFLNAQDIGDDWTTNIAVSDVRIDGGKASAVVVLGKSKPMIRKLAVDLVKEGDAWKIAKVK